MKTAVPALHPIDSVELPAGLDGHHGTTHATVACRWPLQPISTRSACGSPVSSIRSDVRQLTQGSRTAVAVVCPADGQPLSSLTHEDLLVYQHFLADPQPAARWTADGGPKHPRNDPRWRPFYGPLSESSQRQAMVILNVMFAWLVQAGYLAGNPLSLSRRRARRAKPRIVRYLSPELWLDVKTFIQGMPTQSSREREHHARVRWLFTLLYLGGLRITEVGTNTMGRFFRRGDENGKDRWWLEVMGKGNRDRLVPATSEMMTELGAYRRTRGLPALPSPGEDMPLVLPIGQSRKPLTRAALHRIVKDVFSGAAESLRAQDDDHVQRAARLEQASAHWLRHSAGSHMTDQQLDLRLVRDNLGHASLTTTSQYLHMDDDRRHRETDEKHRIEW
ncbi:site-specific recombinase XerD [Paraburkholderia sp. BL27I4N3]|nr:site-specific recombinase XerD [Paraburkholderia sp. BL27I4N3]